MFLFIFNIYNLFLFTKNNIKFMNITKKNNNFSNKSYNYKRKSLIIINSDYSIETLYTLLIKNPILVNQKDEKGETFLSYSIQRNKNDIFDLILTSPILDLNYKDKEGNSYLHIAIQFERENMVKSLINKGILINIQNNDGNTPLHLAYFLNNKNIISYLIDNCNIDLNIKNNNGDIPENLKQKDENNNFESSIIDNFSIDSEIIFDDDSINQNYKKYNYNNRNINIELNNSNMNKNNSNIKLSLSNNKKYLKSFDKINIDKKESNREKIKTNISKFSNSNITNHSISNDSKSNKTNTIISPRINITNNIINEYNNQLSENGNVYFNKNKIKKYNTINSFDNNKYLKKINLTSNILIEPKINTNNDYYNIPSQYKKYLNKEKIKYNKMNLINSNNKKINQTPSFSSLIYENINTSVSEKSTSNDLILFLQSIQMEKYYLNLYSNGFDDIKLIINQTKSNLGITNNNLKESGINFIGDRAKIIIKIQELAGNFSYKIPKEVYYKCENLENIENDENINKLNKWLKEINLEILLSNFITNGYHSIELLLFQLHCKEPLTMNNLKDDLEIKLIGFRQRIYNKLNEDWNKLYNKLKYNLVMVNEENNNVCNGCNIF